jgi:phage terminase large subunit-like protein
MPPRKTQGWPPAYLTPVPPADVRRGDGKLVAEFIEALCPQVKDSIGGKAGEPLILRPWQGKLLDAMFARRADGLYRHRMSLVGMPRKSGKSAVSSGIALYGLIMGPNGGEVYCCAADREQARIVFGTARSMVEMSPELQARTKLYRDAIEVPGTGSVLRVLSAEAYSKEGLSSTLCVIDELHAQPNRALFDVMSLSMAARRDAMLLSITTAGVKSDTTGQDSIAYQLWQYGCQVAAKEVDDPTFFMAWWGVPDGADHRSEATWRAANPGFGDLQDPEDFSSSLKRTPENEFRTKRLNQWTSAQQAWLPGGAWDKLPKAPDVDADTPVVLGFDGSFSGDTTALVGVTVEDKPRVFLVEVWEKQPTDRDDWRVDIGAVEARILETCGRLNVVEVACDPFRWARSMEALAEAGVPIVEYPSSSPARMVPATAKFYDAVTSKGVSHDHHPTLARHLGNCVIRTDAKGPRVVKEHRGSPRKIDAAVAALIAFDRATHRREVEPETPVPAFFSV